jgi:hypothetical protein
MPHLADPSAGSLENLLNQEILFQRKWKRVTMAAYVVTTLGTITCTTVAAVVAALNDAVHASCLAAAATVFISVEKSLMFREKWRLHLTIYTRLRKNIPLNCRLHKERANAVVRYVFDGCLC